MSVNVLSLFDGISCGQVAFKRAGIEVKKYYASEIDKHAIKVTQSNWPNTIQLGSVENWREWDIDWQSIDYLIGGSPCQGFSFAGKQLAFDDPRSKLFFVYVEILNHIKSVNPNVKFLLENVKMKKEYLDVISEHLGVEPVFINSSLVSAQNRQRYYWANWDFGQPEDKGIMLKDILEHNGLGFIKSHGEYKERNEKSQCIDANYHKGADNHGQRAFIANPAAIVGRKLDENGKRNDSLSIKETQCLEVHGHGKSRCLSTVQKDTVVSSLPPGRYPLCEVKTVTFNDRVKGVTQDSRGIRYNKGDKAKSGISELGRILKQTARYTDALTTSHAPKLALNDDVANLKYRKLTPVECERLQTLPDNYTQAVSNTQRYKALGNGWTVDVIAHILEASK